MNDLEVYYGFVFSCTFSCGAEIFNIRLTVSDSSKMRSLTAWVVCDVSP